MPISLPILLSTLPLFKDIPVPKTATLPTVLVVTMKSDKTKTNEELRNVKIPVWPSTVSLKSTIKPLLVQLAPTVCRD